jgi:hypothetical protein
MNSLLLCAAVGSALNLPTQVGPAQGPPRITEGAAPITADLPLQPRPANGKPDIVLRWNEAVLQAIKAEKTSPPQAARNLAMVHGAIYDAVNAITRTRQRYLVDTLPPPGASLEAAACSAAHRVLVDLFPRQISRFDALQDRCLDEIPDTAGKAGGIALGQFVAQRMLRWRSNDGAVQNSNYTSQTGIGLWEPTPPGYYAALLPHWSRVPCFAMRSGDQFRPRPPPALTSTYYTANFQEVKRLGSLHSRERTAEQTEIARFWADGAGTITPPGHWNRIAQTVAQQQSNTLEENARLFALLNIAMADAGIMAWDCKFKFNYWRPVQAIRAADRDGNPDTTANADWTPLLTTPPFPSYVSGHSSFSAAGAAVLALYFGKNEIRFQSSTEGLPGVTRSFASFWNAAQEAGKSRIYGGIHYEFDNEEGLLAGRALGNYVYRFFLR